MRDAVNVTEAVEAALLECDAMRTLIAKHAPECAGASLAGSVRRIIGQRDEALRELRAMRTLAAEQARLRGAR